MRPVYLILIGFICVLLGAFLPYLMVMHFVKSTFFLNFFAYTVSIVGLFLGLIGSAMHVRYTRKKNKDTMLPPDIPPSEIPPDRKQDW
jgi:hypothetical protein